MGKPKVQAQDIFERINFLYQAAHTVLTSNPTNVNLARNYCATLLQIARHQVLRLDPHVKRRICKKCRILLIPGYTCTSRNKSKKKVKRVVVSCLDCGTSRSFNSQKSYRLWSDNPQFESPKSQSN